MSNPGGWLIQYFPLRNCCLSNFPGVQLQCYALPSLLSTEVYSHTFLSCLFVLDSSLACMVASRLWQFVTSRLGSSRPAPTWRLVSDRHDPSTFSGVDIHYPKFTSAIPFRDMTSGVAVETVGDDSWRVVTTRRTVTIRREASPFLRPVTDRVYWTWVEGTSQVMNFSWVA